MGAVRARTPKGVVIVRPPDPEEDAAVERAAEKLKELIPGYHSPKALVYAVISAWIVERVRLSQSRKICGEFAFGLGDAHLRGSLEAMLPSIAGALSGLPSDVPFFDLSKEQVIDVLVAGFHAGRDVGSELNDEIPI